MPHARLALVAAIIYVVALGASPVVLAQLADVQTTGPANADVIAISATGDSSSQGGTAVSLFGNSETHSGTSVSLTGNATNRECFGSSGTDVPECTAISGFGAASNKDAWCTSPRVACTAISGTGDATNEGRYCNADLVRCVAVSGTGNATNFAPFFECSSVLVGCVAISGTGDARNEGAYACKYSGGVSCLAVAPLGSASNTCDERLNLQHTTVACYAFDRDDWMSLLP